MKSRYTGFLQSCRFIQHCFYPVFSKHFFYIKKHCNLFHLKTTYCICVEKLLMSNYCIYPLLDGKQILRNVVFYLSYVFVLPWPLFSSGKRPKHEEMNNESWTMRESGKWREGGRGWGVGGGQWVQLLVLILYTLNGFSRPSKASVADFCGLWHTHAQTCCISVCF